MTFYELKQAVALLQDDPRVTDNTRVDVRATLGDPETLEWVTTQEPAGCVALEDRVIVVSEQVTDGALVRG